MSLLGNFNLAQPWWLLAMLLPALLWMLPVAKGLLNQRYKNYADAALLPHLLLNREQATNRRRRKFSVWAALWLVGCVAMAGPRWDYRTVDLMQPGADVIVLLDISRSMAAADVKPSRLARARQEIEDLLDRAGSLRVGVIAFASVAHVVAPITEDLETVRHVLPALSTDLVQMSGSRLGQGLHKAAKLLSGQPPGTTHSLLLISDGDFDEPGLVREVAALKAQGITLHVLGVGTAAGARVPKRSPRGGWVTDAQGRKVISRLDEPLLREMAQAGGGIYQLADYRDADSNALIEVLQADGDSETLLSRGAHRIWNEQYPWLVVLMMLLLIPWFRGARQP